MRKNKLIENIDFGNEAGDDIDPSELAEYFVEQTIARDFLNYRYGLLVATAKKGVGKSALINWASYKLPKIRKGMLIISLRGSELSRQRLGSLEVSDSPSDFIQNWMVRICTIINRELAKSLKLAISDDSILKVEAAEIEGYKQQNIVRSLINRFQNLIPEINASQVAISNEVEVLRRAKPKPVWLLIDDLDATFQNTQKECLELATFFTACRYLVRDLKGLNIRVTMRTDVWPIIRRYDESLDKLEQYVKDLKWTDDEYRRLLARRVKYEMDRLEFPYSEPPRHVHDIDRDNDLIRQVIAPKFPWGQNNRQVDSYQVLYTLSYARPRWAIQLCKLAQKDVIDHEENLISKENIDNVWGTYGNKRISDLISEHKHQCPEVEELLNGFRGAPRVLSRDELITWIKNHITNHMKPFVDGVKITTPGQVGKFLFRIGFLQARSQEESGTYEHYNFDDMPDFLSSRTNEDFGVLWEIHPSFRESLDIEKLNFSQRVKKGLIRNRKKY